MIGFNCPGLEHSKRTKGRLRCLPEREKRSIVARIFPARAEKPDPEAMS